MRLLLSLGIVLLWSCQKPISINQPISIAQKEAAYPIDQLPEIEVWSPMNGDNVDFLPLAWESSKSPERTQWSEIAYAEIEKRLDQLDLAKDAVRFCPNYPSLTNRQKINFWGQLIASISYFESGWNPTTRFHESTMGTDPVTKKPIYSEGLLQLSYQDTLWYKHCDFNWNQDKNLKSNDPQKTIFDPAKNLSCGIGILARQIQRYQQIILKSNVYWAVIREGGRYNRINPIVEIVRQHDYCLTKY